MAYPRPGRFRFASFEADIATSELFENGVRVPMQEKPFLFLATLLQSDGAVVTREELSLRLWPDTHVQVNQGLNAASRKVRQALRDDAARPRFIETLGSRGYRFICPVQELPSNEPSRVSAPRPSLNGAFLVHETYLRGRHYWNKRTPPALNKSLVCFEQVLAADPNHPLALAGVADAYNMLATHGLLVPREAYKKAKASASRALALDPDLAEAHVGLGWAMLSLDYAWSAARQGFERAIELNPEYAFAYNGYSYLLLASGRVEEGIEAMQRGRELDPLSLPLNSVLSNCYYYARQYERAVKQAASALELDPQFPIAHACLGLAYLELGKHKEALEHFENAVRFSAQAPIMVAHLALGLAVTGHTLRAQETLRELTTESDHRIPPAFHIALIHAALGDEVSAFKWLERACEDRFHWTMFLQIDPRLDNLRQHKDFERICAQFPKLK